MKSKEVLFWSLVLPGFGQLLNKKYLKGITLLCFDFVVNIKANFNKAIMLSFLGDIRTAIDTTNYTWLLFFPCLYFFAMWDAVKDAGGNLDKFAFLPYVFSAFFATAGILYSSKAKIFGVLLGPVWMPALSAIPGLLLGYLLKIILERKSHFH